MEAQRSEVLCSCAYEAASLFTSFFWSMATWCAGGSSDWWGKRRSWAEGLLAALQIPNTSCCQLILQLHILFLNFKSLCYRCYLFFRMHVIIVLTFTDWGIHVIIVFNFTDRGCRRGRGACNRWNSDSSISHSITRACRACKSVSFFYVYYYYFFNL